MVLAEYAVKLFKQRAGVEILTNEPVQSIDPGVVHLKDKVIEADTIVLSAGILPNPVVTKLPLARDKHGHVMVENTMRSKERPEIWAIGDCASIPDANGKPYPKLGAVCDETGGHVGKQSACDTGGKGDQAI